MVRTGQPLVEARALSGLDEVLARGYDGTGVKVAILDTGIDSSHPDLTGKVVDEACFCGSGCCPDGSNSQSGPGSAADGHGHGTHVAGAIASRGGQSPGGGAPGVTLVAVKVLSDALGFCCMSDVVDALAWLAANHPDARVINASLGATARYGGDCDALHGALTPVVAELAAAGATVVAASGNDGDSDGMRAPACLSEVLSVGAVWDADVGSQSIYCAESSTAADRIACFGNRSATTDLLAPGGVIDSAWLGGGSMASTGTSHAAPLVSACLADLWQAKPDAGRTELLSSLRSSGVLLHDAASDRSYRRLDCAAALEQLLPTPAPPTDAAAADDGADAGTPVDEDAGRGAIDAAVDASVPSPDAAREASGMAEADSGLQASKPEVIDAATTGPDAAPSEPEAAGPHTVGVHGGGCDCSAGHPSENAATCALLLLALALVERRRHLARPG
ncbi:MAG: S8 family serine peptidase [Myxococcales bacterium]|nr:S8 family serine peptidase [Myxococcales bacterium]